MSKKFDLQAFKRRYLPKNGGFYGLVYVLVNKINNKTYVGQTTTPFSRRWTNHKNHANFYHTPIARAIKKYGSNNFETKILSYCASAEILDSEEAARIVEYGALLPQGYNILAGGRKSTRPDSYKKTLIKRPPWNKGKKLGVNLALAKPIIGTSPEGLELSFLSAGQAEREMGFSAKHISACCLGKRRTHKNFKWRYRNDG